MSWRVNYSSQAAKFIQKNPPHAGGVKECLKLFIKKLSGETVPLDIKKMKGTWQDSFRVRKGDIRIILSNN
jgi:mRNA-degrading endonuclease RelE of RelBE toxin-antitoxin system